jgi:biotin transport system substrate-specific component
MREDSIRKIRLAMQNRDIARISAFSALIGVLGLLPKLDLPFSAGVPITAQTLGVMLAGLLLGARQGALAVGLFVFLVACGAPLLSGGRGGIGILLGPTGGYLVGWILGVYCIGLLKSLFFSSPSFLGAFVSAFLGGVIVIHAVGTPWLAWISGITIPQAAIATFAFLPGDLLKALAAAYIYKTYVARSNASLT